MGRKEKNEKKAERISALRKKYESFLEEDRKRKARNEYILGQLDKMRTCNSIVQPFKNKPVEANLTKLPMKVDLQRRYLRPRDFDVELAIPLLKKITENYILIPKLRRPLENTEEISQLGKESVDDPDWQTKYEILNILKKAEKGESEAEITNDTLQSSQQFTKRVHSFDISKDIPERDSVFDEIIVPPITKSTKTFNSYPVKLGKDSQDDDKTITTGECDAINESGHKINEVHIKSNEKLEYDDENGLNPAHIYYPREDIGKPLGDIPRETEDQYPIKIINVEEFTPHDDVVLKDGENINPKIIETMRKSSEQEHLKTFKNRLNQEIPLRTDGKEDKLTKKDETETSHISQEPYTKIAMTDLASSDIKSDIQEFEREQEQFYQPAISKPQKTLEPVQHSFDKIPDNVKENQQYYYTGPHENPESVFISEHEETSSPYDQSYAQQYMAAELPDNQTLDVVATTNNNQVEVPAETYEGYEHPAVYEGQDTYEVQEALAAYAGQETYENQADPEAYKEQEIFEGQEQPTVYQGQEGYAGQQLPAANVGQESYAGQEIPPAYVGQETYEGQEHPANYEGPEAYIGQEVPAAYAGQVNYEGQEHSAAYEGQETYEGQEIPAAYVGQETYEGQEHPVAYGGQEAYKGQEHPAYGGQEIYKGQEHQAPYEGQQIYTGQEVPAAYAGQETYEGQDHPVAYEGPEAAYVGQETYEGQEHPTAYEGQEAYAGQEVPAAYVGQETYEGQEHPAAYEGQETYEGQKIPAVYEGQAIYEGQQELNAPQEAFQGLDQNQEHRQEASEGQQGEVYAPQQHYDQTDIAAPYNESTHDVQGVQYNQEYSVAENIGNEANNN